MQIDAFSRSPETQLGKEASLKQYQTINAEFMKEVEESACMGKTLLCGGEDVNDQSVLVWIEKDGNLKTLNFMCKLQEKADKVLLKSLSSRHETSLAEGSIPVFQKNLKDGSLEKSKETFLLPEGKTYTADLGDGFYLTYHPFEKNYSEFPEENVTPYSTQGILSVTCKSSGFSEKDIKKFQKKLSKLGIDSHLSTPKDLELIYLRRMIWSLNMETPEFRSGVENSSSTEDKISLCRRFLEEKLGIDDITKVSEYDWRPHFDTFPGQNGLLKAGWASWRRFDASTYLENELKDYHPYLNLYGSRNTYADRIVRMIHNGGFFLSTEERLDRLGLKRAGIAPSFDRNTGGAYYVFTHLGKNSEKGDVSFYSDLLKRSDHLAYNVGKFGRVYKNKAENKVPLPAYHRSPVYELMFKHSVSIIDYVKEIRVDGEEDRQKIIKAFQDTGIYNIRGKAVEDIVIMR